jgi:hypothetical protein
MEPRQKVSKFEGTKRWVILISVGAAALLLALAIRGGKQVRADESDDLDDEASRIQRGYDSTPVPLDLTGKNRALVGLGSYYVNAVGSCADCHTNFPQYAAGGNPFLGQPKEINVANYLRGGRPFPAADPTGVENPIRSRSLRPEDGLPAGLTFDEFVDVMRNGTDYDHPGRLLQVMGWPIFQNMTDRDLLAIYLYLSTLPP